MTDGKKAAVSEARTAAVDEVELSGGVGIAGGQETAINKDQPMAKRIIHRIEEAIGTRFPPREQTGWFEKFSTF